MPQGDSQLMYGDRLDQMIVLLRKIHLELEILRKIHSELEILRKIHSELEKIEEWERKICGLLATSGR